MVAYRANLKKENKNNPGCLAFWNPVNVVNHLLMVWVRASMYRCHGLIVKDLLHDPISF